MKNLRGHYKCLKQPIEGNSVQHQCNAKAYHWLNKDCCARFTMLSTMYNDIIGDLSITPKEY